MDIQSASSVVLQALTQATSQDTAVLKPAEEQLRQWETQPGFYSVLLRMRCLWTLRPGQYNPSRPLRGAQQHPCCHTALAMVV
ncbi:importin-11-like [Sinocyclocheilus rhinocerous]|uniref:importin-11-like n=1 Tax=Sinocyclocheilus rhinocerous TaxID=307959 RepID=UPI0007B8E8A5|nr:PREDICTED: importin-11-like [Sinocyclocheilus rhinocerous]